VAGRAVGPEQVWPFDRLNQRRRLLSGIRRGLTLLACCKEDDADERNRQHEEQSPLDSFVRRHHRRFSRLQQLRQKLNSMRSRTVRRWLSVRAATLTAVGPIGEQGLYLSLCPEAVSIRDIPCDLFADNPV